MPTTTKISNSQAKGSDKYTRGRGSRNRRAIRSGKYSASVSGGPGRFRETILRSLLKRAVDMGVIQQGTRAGSKKTSPIIAYGQPPGFKTPVRMRPLVKPMPGKDTFISHQAADFSGPETVRDLHKWLQTQRGIHSTSETVGDPAPVDEPTGRAVPNIQEQDGFDTVLSKLEQARFRAVANRIRHLQDEIDEEEGEDLINIDSLRAFAEFILMEQGIGSPSTWIDPRGFLGLEWRIPDHARPGRTDDANSDYWGKGDGILAMVFLSSGLIRFSGTSGPVGQGIERLNVSGTYPPSDIMEAVQPFISRVESQW